jgi:hypothetical protein
MRMRKTLMQIVQESIEEVLNQEYRVKKAQPEPEEKYDCMDKLDPTVDDIKEKFADEPEYNDKSAGSDYEVNPDNPVFYVNGKEMSAESITPFHNGFAIVKCNGQQGFIDKDGELVGGKFYARCDDFEDGWGLVVNNEGKRNYVNGQGEYLLDHWVGRASTFMNGEAIVLDNGKRYKIDTQGNVL